MSFAFAQVTHVDRAPGFRPRLAGGGSCPDQQGFEGREFVFREHNPPRYWGCLGRRYG
jgi:hypothetical protein